LANREERKGCEPKNTLNRQASLKVACVYADELLMRDELVLDILCFLANDCQSGALPVFSPAR
jgi:hypothetical protein